MVGNICICCGQNITKSSEDDPYLCRECDRLIDGAEVEERYRYLDDW